jgi:hypothetical protein
MQVLESEIFLGMAAKQKRTMEDEDMTQELFLDMTLDTHTSENEETSRCGG